MHDAAKLWKSPTGTPGMVVSSASQSVMNGRNTAAHAADGQVAGNEHEACSYRRWPPPPLGQQASIAAAVSAWKSCTRV